MQISDTIRFVLRHRRWVLLALTAGVALSAYAAVRAPLDAIPDIADPQVVIYAKWARSPGLLESEVTAPLVEALRGVPGVDAVRGTSHMGYAFVYAILAESADRDAAVREISERIGSARVRLPSDADVSVGPNASSVSWIYQYALVDRSGARDLRELRSLHESVVKPALLSAPGVAEVASVGGLEARYQIELYPALLADAGVSLRQIIDACREALPEVGGRTLDVTQREYQLRGSLPLDSAERLEDLVVARGPDARAIRVKDLGYVKTDSDLRRSIADLDGEGEVAGGIVLMENGQNVLAVTRSIERRIAQLAAALPAGVEIVPAYERASLVVDKLAGFAQTLAYELAVTIAVVLVFLRNMRAAVAPISILLLATLFTVLPMAAFGQTINLLSLAGLAIAIGEMVDATIVIVESCTAELAARGSLSASEARDLIVRSIAGVAPPLLFSLLIILASFAPVFFLGAREARLFDPLAFTKTAAMAFSTLLTLILLPIVIVWIFRRGAPPQSAVAESSGARVYRRLLGAAIAHRYLVAAAHVALLVPALWLLTGIRKDYMPELEEGSVLYMPTTLPGLPTREAGWVLQQMDRRLKELPEVARVFGKLGRADTGTDPAPLSMIETTILLRPRSEWREGMTKARLVAEMNDALQVAGFANAWTQPIAARVVMQNTGIQTPVGVKVKGPDLAGIERIGGELERVLAGVPGTASVIAERISDGYFVDAELDSRRMADESVLVDEALATLRYGIGGESFASVRHEDGARIPLALRYSMEHLDTLAKVRTAPVVTADGRSVPLAAIAQVSVRKLPEMIRNDGGLLAGHVLVYLKDTTPADFVESARPIVAREVSLPPGYELEWTGLAQYTTEAQQRLMVVVPLTLAIIFGLLMLTFRSLPDTILAMLSIPFALVGGVLLQAALGYAMTTAVVIGYVSLFAIAIQTGIIMVVFIREALGRRVASQSFADAVIEGSVLRLRPKLMTVVATALSLLPVMISGEEGTELMKPIATPSLGGMATSVVCVLFLIPCLFVIADDVRQWLTRPAQDAVSAEDARA